MRAFDQFNQFFARNKKKSVVLLIVASVIIIPTCVSKQETKPQDLRGELYAGSASCKNCHAAVYDTYIHTAHNNTSSDSLPGFLEQAFANDKNVFRFNDSISVVMEKTEGHFYQSLYQNARKEFSAPLDIVVGSGRKAQTFLYYNSKGKLSQLPISYFMSQVSWANSPGFPAEHPKFDRNVPSYCMGCHSSYIGVKQTYKGVALEEEFEKGKVIYGIDCERCHGPASEHVNYHESNPQDKVGKFITRIATLNRVQKNDGCALCHSGFRNVQQSLFQFKPGDDINNFYVPEYGRADTSNLDVHGNQTQLMLASKCYQLSNDMSCTSCHNVHIKERDNISTLSQRCIACHKQVDHSFAGKVGDLNSIVQNNCIDCHMPLKASSLITMMTRAKTDAYPDYVRTHLVTKYKEETQRFLDSVSHRSRSH